MSKINLIIILLAIITTVLLYLVGFWQAIFSIIATIIIVIFGGALYLLKKMPWEGMLYFAITLILGYFLILYPFLKFLKFLSTKKLTLGKKFNGVMEKYPILENTLFWALLVLWTIGTVTLLFWILNGFKLY